MNKVKKSISTWRNAEEKRVVTLTRKKRMVRKNYSLEELVSKITPKNRYEEIDFGPPVGKEIV